MILKNIIMNKKILHYRYSWDLEKRLNITACWFKSKSLRNKMWNLIIMNDLKDVNCKKCKKNIELKIKKWS